MHVTWELTWWHGRRQVWRQKEVTSCIHLHCGLSAYHATHAQSCDARLDKHTPASAPYLDPTSPLQAPLALLACWPGQKVAVASHATLLWHSQSQIDHSPQLHLVLAQLTHTCSNASMHDHKCMTTHMFMHHAHLSQCLRFCTWSSSQQWWAGVEAVCQLLPDL